jgi:hypothetical protein
VGFHETLRVSRGFVRFVRVCRRFVRFANFRTGLSDLSGSGTSRISRTWTVWILGSRGSGWSGPPRTGLSLGAPARRGRGRSEGTNSAAPVEPLSTHTPRYPRFGGGEQAWNSFGGKPLSRVRPSPPRRFPRRTRRSPPRFPPREPPSEPHERPPGQPTNPRTAS